MTRWECTCAHVPETRRVANSSETLNTPPSSSTTMAQNHSRPRPTHRSRSCNQIAVVARADWNFRLVISMECANERTERQERILLRIRRDQNSLILTTQDRHIQLEGVDDAATRNDAPNATKSSPGPTSHDRKKQDVTHTYSKHAYNVDERPLHASIATKSRHSRMV